ncbi:MAG: hypothetical protein HEQ39_15525 [Rhizobacter sp.]
MKTYDIQFERVKGMRNAHGLIYLQLDATVAPKAASNEGEPCSVLTLSEEQARVIMAAIKSQLLELDKRKAKSRRG